MSTTTRVKNSFYATIGGVPPARCWLVCCGRLWGVLAWDAGCLGVLVWTWGSKGVLSWSHLDASCLTVMRGQVNSTWSAPLVEPSPGAVRGVIAARRMRHRRDVEAWGETCVDLVGRKPLNGGACPSGRRGDLSRRTRGTSRRCVIARRRRRKPSIQLVMRVGVVRRGGCRRGRTRTQVAQGRRAVG